jgi:hypothetical protein
MKKIKEIVLQPTEHKGQVALSHKTPVMPPSIPLQRLEAMAGVPAIIVPITFKPAYLAIAEIYNTLIACSCLDLFLLWLRNAAERRAAQEVF